MTKTEWNTGKSFAVTELSEAELKEAIKEWAEGSKTMEDLLWSCYRNGVHTYGCDAGNHGPVGYLEISMDDCCEGLKRIIDATLNFGSSEIFLKNIGNPYGGSLWYKPTLSIKTLEHAKTNKFFESIRVALEEKKEIKNIRFVEKTFKLLECLNNIEIPINIRLARYCNWYRICIEFEENRCIWNHLKKIFKKADFELDWNLPTDAPCIGWIKKFELIEEMEEYMDIILKILSTEYFLNVLEEITDDMDFNTKALVMRKKFGTDETGIKLMNKWLNENKSHSILPDVNY